MQESRGRGKGNIARVTGIAASYGEKHLERCLMSQFAYRENFIYMGIGWGSGIGIEKDKIQIFNSMETQLTVSKSPSFCPFSIPVKGPAVRVHGGYM